MSILVGIRAIGAAASTPNWSLRHIVQAATSLGNDEWQQWQKNRRKKSGRRGSYNKQTRTLINHGSHHHLIANIKPHSWHQITQKSSNMLANRFVLLKIGKIIVNHVY
jgi:hypothetical protein